jgi:hypothetical protein
MDDVAVGNIIHGEKIKTRDVSSDKKAGGHQPQPAPDTSALANYVCARLHQYESAHRLIFTQPGAHANAARKSLMEPSLFKK